MEMILKENLQPVYDYLEALVGTSADRISTTALGNAVSHQMNQFGTESVDEYLRILDASLQARDQLISSSTVKETYFFRESSYLQLLVRQYLPRFLAESDPITLISAGCSTGAEAYSLAIAIHHAFGASVLKRCRIIGFDIDRDALAQAKRGVYSSYTLRGMDRALRDRYLRKGPNTSYTVDPMIRDSVEFRKINLLDSGKIRKLGSADVIVYRNVSIYFSTAVRLQVFTALSDLLTSRGLMFTGSSETLSHDFGVLALVSQNGLFYFTPHSSEIPAVPKINSQPVVPKAKERTPKQYSAEHRIPRDALEEALESARSGSFERALHQLDAAVPNEQKRIDYAILRAGVLFHLKRFEEAVDLCRTLSEQAPLRSEPYLLQAMIHRIEGYTELALQEMKKVLYLEPECWIAAYYSAELYKQLGNRKQAHTFYRRVILSLEQDKRKDDLLVFSLNAIASKQIIRLCRHELACL